MTARWVAGSVRARALARRRIGSSNAQTLAACASVDEALAELMATPYSRDLLVPATLAQAQHAAAATVLWHLRVLAGWLPRDAAGVLRVLAGWFDIANVDERLHGFAGGSPEPSYDLGALGTASARLSAATSPGEIRHVLATSSWGDPGADDARAISLAMRFVWAERVCARVPQARAWARGAAALTVVREQLVAGRPLPDVAAGGARRLLGGAALEAASMSELRVALDRDARWALSDVDESSLWIAEAAWWRRVEADGLAMLRRPRPGPEPVVGAVVVLAADARRVRAALECADRGASAMAVFDAVA